MLAFQAAVVLLTLLAAGYTGRLRDSLALVRPAQGWRAIPLGLIGLFAVLGVFVAIVNVVGPQDTAADMKPFLPIFQSDQWWQALLMAGVGAPLSEELLFRGFLFSAFANTRWLGVTGAAVLTTVAWTAVHGYSGIGTLEVAMMGLYFSWLLWKTGSLWTTIACHAIYNSLLALTMVFGTLPGAG
jgi:membrane protease YdiL (CAAX protease family)